MGALDRGSDACSKVRGPRANKRPITKYFTKMLYRFAKKCGAWPPALRRQTP